MLLGLSRLRSRCRNRVFLCYALFAFAFLQMASPHSHVNHTHAGAFAIADATDHAHIGQTHTIVSQPSDEHHGAGLEIDAAGPVVLKTAKVFGDLPVILVFLTVFLLSLQLYGQRWAVLSNISFVASRDKAIRPPLRAPPR